MAKVRDSRAVHEAMQRLRAPQGSEKISARGSVYGCLSASLALEGLTRVLREHDAFHLEVERET